MNLPEQLQRAATAAQQGDYPNAIALWQEALSADAGLRAQIVTDLARAQIEEGLYYEAIALLNAHHEQDPPAAIRAETFGLLAIAHEGLGEWSQAIDAYQRYLAIETIAEAHVRERIAAAHVALGQGESAVSVLVGMPWGQLPGTRRAQALEELARIQRQVGDYEGALATYDQILAFATIANYRALITQRRGVTLWEAGRTDEAIATLSDIVLNTPRAPAAALALDSLDTWGVSLVNERQRGIIYHHAGRQEQAIAALQRHLAAGGDDPALALFFLGTAHQRLRNHEQAMVQFATLIEQHPDHALLADAWMARARSLLLLGGDAASLYAEFATRHPQHPGAPQALWLAADAAERFRNWPVAAQMHQRLYQGYPADERADEARFREGLAAYAMQDWERARSIFGESVERSPSSLERARRLTWLGKATQAMGDAQAAQEHWQEAHRNAPWRYYGLRARDLLANRALRLPDDAPVALGDGALSEGEWAELAAWLQTWAGAGVLPDLGGRVLAQRGDALMRLGWSRDAFAVYRLLHSQLADDPWGLLALARRSQEMGVYPVMVQAAERLRHLASAAGAAAPPPPLLRLAHPIVYGPLVSDKSAQQGVDPLLFMALIRQESRFDRYGLSWAGATGLTQVMPATGEWIAQQLGETVGYRHELLYRPAVSIRFGTFYLGNLLRMNNRDWIAALVGYNAGAGNLRRLSGGQPIQDHDLFYEMIFIAETKAYVRIIYENYAMYQELYR